MQGKSIEKLIDQHLNDPEVDKTRRQLADLLKSADSEIEDREVVNREAEDAEETAFLPPSSMMRKPKGPLINQNNAKRERDAEEKVKRIMGENYIPPEGVKPKPQIKQSFNPDIEPEDENEEPIKERKTISNGNRDRRVVNGDANAPIDPPTITAIDRLEKRLRDQEKEIEYLKSEKGIPTVTDTPRKPAKLAARRVKYDSKYSKIEPPSNGVFSDFDFGELFAKNIDLPTQELITKARLPEIRDMSSYIDALSTLIKEPIDLRDFTYDDFFYFLYYTKFNSYTRIPLVLRWVSKYGNENFYKIQETDLKYINPVITKEQYIENFKSKGIVMPTLRDWEILNVQNDFDEEDLDIYRRAQYFEGNSIEEKVDHYFRRGEDLEALSIVAELKQVSQHGVINTVDLIDAKFNANKYIEARIEYTDALKREMEYYKEENLPLYLSYRKEVDESELEIKEKQAILQNGGQVRPEVETVPVRFNALDIFPIL